jgi:hypothetical protein
MFGCVLNRKVRDKIHKLYSLKTERAELLGGLRIPRTKVSEKDLEESANKVIEENAEEAKV